MPVLPHPPLSASSEITLFDPNVEGPQAESTPHESQRAYNSRPSSADIVPPVPRIPSDILNAEKRRSSIIYIKSDENVSPPAAESTPQPTRSNSRRFAQWSSRAVRPLIPKAKDKSENAGSAPPGGLRQLSLLQDRDVNRASGSTRPLALGKGKKSAANDENAAPSKKLIGAKGLKPLKLSRSETTKERAALRESEVLPNVIVRPPSLTQNTPFGYSFQ